MGNVKYCWWLKTPKKQSRFFFFLFGSRLDLSELGRVNEGRFFSFLHVRSLGVEGGISLKLQAVRCNWLLGSPLRFSLSVFRPTCCDVHKSSLQWRGLPLIHLVVYWRRNIRWCMSLYNPSSTDQNSNTKAKPKKKKKQMIKRVVVTTRLFYVLSSLFSFRESF